MTSQHHQQNKKPYTEVWRCPKCGLDLHPHQEITYRPTRPLTVKEWDSIRDSDIDWKEVFEEASQ